MSLPESQVPVMKRADALEGFLYLQDGVYDVRNYGAIGDGTTDDTAAILAAITAAGANSVVKFGAGKTYKTTSVITVPTDGVVLWGYGATITSATDSQFRKFRFVSRTRGAVLGFKFDCLYTSATTGLGEGVVEIANSTNISVRDCEFNEVAKNGVYFSGSSARCLVESNRFWKNFCAIFSDDDTVNQPTRLRIANNDIRAGVGTTATAFSGAIKFSGTGSATTAGGHVIEGNVIDTPGEMGIELHTFVNDCVISANSISGSGFGISVAASCYRTAVSGNTVRNAASYGIELAGCVSTVVSGNTISSAALTGYGLLITASASDVSISGGTITGHSAGIYCQNSTRVVINALEITGTGDPGPLYIKSTTDVTVSNCLLVAIVATAQFIVLDSADSNISRIIITGNRLSGTVVYNGITFVHSANVIQDVLISNNSTIDTWCPGGAYSESGGSAITRMLRIRAIDNVGGGDPNNSFNLPLVSTSSSVLFFYHYYQTERGVYSIDATGGVRAIELPPPGSGGAMRTVQKSDGSGNTVTVSAYGGATINGGASVVLSTQYQRVTVLDNGTNYTVVQSN